MALRCRASMWVTALALAVKKRGAKARHAASLLLHAEMKELPAQPIDRRADGLLAAVARERLEGLPERVVQIGLVLDDVSAASDGVDGESRAGNICGSGAAQLHHHY